MRYTISALATSEPLIEVLRQHLLAVGAPNEAIMIASTDRNGLSLAQVSVKTDDLDASQSYRRAMELDGGTQITSSEESSVLNVIP
ncbi:MAG: hypothetical protein H0W78_11510 [Planctomycetes bacterium]|nr:hypothetical protein [Planctomycetota bacterium]